MKLYKNLVLAATFICGLSSLTSCSDKSDNPVEPQPVPEVNAQRIAFEEQYSKQLQSAADNMKFTSAKEAISSLQEFIALLDENALKEQVGEILTQLVGGATPVDVASLTADEQADVAARLKERFNMTDEEVAATTAFVSIDASKALGKLHLTFKDGKCTAAQDGEGFTVESHKPNGDVLKFVLNFDGVDDGVRFFATRVANTIPMALQLPQIIGITLTTPKGKVLSGDISLGTSVTSRYVSFKNTNWVGNANLTADVDGSKATLSALIIHEADHSYNGRVELGLDGRELISLTAIGVGDPYPEGYVDSDELKQLREMGAGYAALYEVIKTFNNKTVEDLTLTLVGDLSFQVRVDDIAKSALALGNISKLSGTKPSFETMDKYVQELNGYLHATASQESTGISAHASLLTYLQNGEYVPAVALTFEGEKEPQAMSERMSETDNANYQKIVDTVGSVLSEMAKLVEAAAAKGKVVGEAVKF